MTPTIREDLVLGTVHGAAASALLWTLFLHPPGWETPSILMLLIAAGSGAVRPRLGRLGRISSTFPSALCGLLLGGPGLGMLGALAAEVGRGWIGRRRAGRVASRLAFGMTRTTLACAAGTGAFLLVSGSWGTAEGWAIVAHGLAFLTTDRLLRGLRRGWGRLALAVRPRDVWVLAAYSIGGATAWTAAALLERPGGQWAMLALLVFGLLGAVHAARCERHRLVHHHRAASVDLCRSVTEAFAYTMEARDEQTRDHLRRVQGLCVEIGRHIGLEGLELEALAAAALLHDIGKVAVPEEILSKPGRLTAEEMAQVRVHPAVGAEILQNIPFPYPLAPIVRHHHERWDGRGYPAGLRGEAIPLGSRILSAVDGYDALTSERPYRRAVSHEEAVCFLRRESGGMLDPSVVEAMIDHFAHEAHVRLLEAPGEVTAASEPAPPEPEANACGIPRSQQELRMFYDLVRAAGYAMQMDDYLALVSTRLGELVAFRSFVVYFLSPSERILKPGFVVGRAADQLRSVRVPLGERLSGWAALQRRAFVGSDHRTPVERDGSRSDLEDLRDDPEVATLRSTLVAPMVVGDRLVGVVTLYDDAERQFSAEDRRLLVRVAGAIGEACRERTDEPAGDGLTDPLTGVPNAHFLRLESSHRIAGSTDEFGLLAFRVVGLDRVVERMGNRAADRLTAQIARRFAASCGEHETLVRFGQDLFVVLTATGDSGALVGRWHALAVGVEDPPVELEDGVLHRVRLVAAHAAYPEDGAELDAMLDVLEERLRLGAARGRTVVPFSTRRRETVGSAG